MDNTRYSDRVTAIELTYLREAVRWATSRSLCYLGVHPPTVIALYAFVPQYDDVIKWKPFPRYWSFVRGIHQSPVNSPHKNQWREALVFSLIWAWINSRVNNREAGDLRRHRAQCDVIMMNATWIKPDIVIALQPFNSTLWERPWGAQLVDLFVI